MILTRRSLILTAGGLALAPHAFANASGRIPFEYANSKIFAPVMVNGQPVQALLDTGSAFLGFDTVFADKAGIRRNGRRALVRGVQHVMRGARARVDRLSVGEAEFSNLPAIVIDYGDLSSSVGRDIEMALGGEILQRFVIDLDFIDETMALTPREAFTPPEGLVPVTLSGKQGVMTAPIVFPGRQTLWAIVDTGTASPLIVSPLQADRLGLLRGRVSTAPLNGIGGATVARITTAPRLSLGGVAFDEVPVQVPPQSLGADANIGMALLGRFHVWLDFAGHKMWLKPQDVRGPFRRDLLGFYGETHAGALRVDHVAPGSPAAEAGFRPGEMVTAINGRPAAAAAQAFRDAAAGAVLVFTLADGRSRSLTLARYY